MNGPSYLSTCSPDARLFPLDWKVAFYRQHGGCTSEGYRCPGCSRFFSGDDGFDELHADHRVPFSQGGPTVWANLQLLCGPCNLAKSNSEGPQIPC